MNKITNYQEFKEVQNNLSELETKQNEKFINKIINLKEKKETIPTYNELLEMEQSGEAEIIETAYEGQCQLWRCNNGKEFVILQDNTVITREEDIFIDPIFPL